MGFLIYQRCQILHRLMICIKNLIWKKYCEHLFKNHVSFGISWLASISFKENFQIYTLSSRKLQIFCIIFPYNHSQCTILNAQAHQLHLNMNPVLLSKIQSHYKLSNFLSTADIWVCSTTMWRQGGLNQKNLLSKHYNHKTLLFNSKTDVVISWWCMNIFYMLLFSTGLCS